MGDLKTRSDSKDNMQAQIRPGWIETGIGLLMMAVLGFGGGILISRLPIGAVAIGLIFTGLSGVAAMGAFLAAYALRIRDWHAFGIRATTSGWILTSIGVGLIAFVIKGLAILGYVWMTGDSNNPQEIYATGASGGIWTIVLATLLLGIVTPVGEEFLFRGVVTSALLRYGPVIGVGGSALIFALFHGINLVFPAALVAGIAAGEVFRRSGSIWTAVTIHVIFNLPTIPVLLLAGTAR